MRIRWPALMLFLCIVTFAFGPLIYSSFSKDGLTATVSMAAYGGRGGLSDWRGKRLAVTWKDKTNCVVEAKTVKRSWFETVDIVELFDFGKLKSYNVSEGSNQFSIYFNGGDDLIYCETDRGPKKCKNSYWGFRNKSDFIGEEIPSLEQFRLRHEEAMNNLRHRLCHLTGS